MALKRVDEKFVVGEWLSYEDKGYISVTATTRKYLVKSRKDQSVLGYVKFFAQWRQYVFHPLNCILNKDCLREIAEFCIEVTTANRMKRLPFPASEQKPVVEAVTSE